MVEIVNGKEIPVEIIGKDEVAGILDKIQNGRIFSVTFVKKDGTERKMNCRRAVQIGQVGGELKYNPKDHGLVAVYDMQEKNSNPAKNYRMINPITTTEIKTNGRIYMVGK